MYESLRMSLILKNKINCVIVKDLSRFAREYIDAGYYLEKLFPAMGIRFIAINDNIDYREDDSHNAKLVIAFKNILNDSYIHPLQFYAYHPHISDNP